jgi:hypothetical protein
MDMIRQRSGSSGRCSRWSTKSISMAEYPNACGEILLLPRAAFNATTQEMQRYQKRQCYMQIQQHAPNYRSHTLSASTYTCL